MNAQNVIQTEIKQFYIKVRKFKKKMQKKIKQVFFYENSKHFFCLETYPKKRMADPLWNVNLVQMMLLQLNWTKLSTHLINDNIKMIKNTIKRL